jgi:macrodomain Ter protein organizer (MatP/YcbG family)
MYVQNDLARFHTGYVHIKWKMYFVDKNHETGETIEKYIDTSNRTYLHQWMMDKIENKFKQFQINFLF